MAATKANCGYFNILKTNVGYVSKANKQLAGVLIILVKKICLLNKIYHQIL